MKIPIKCLKVHIHLEVFISDQDLSYTQSSNLKVIRQLKMFRCEKRLIFLWCLLIDWIRISNQFTWISRLIGKQWSWKCFNGKDIFIHYSSAYSNKHLFDDNFFLWIFDSSLCYSYFKKINRSICSREPHEGESIGLYRTFFYLTFIHLLFYFSIIVKRWRKTVNSSTLIS